MDIESFVSHLDKARKTGDRSYQACCPAHDDNSPSLAVTAATDGRILIHCYAGCDPSSVMSAVGLSLSDLFEDGPVDDRLKGATPWIGKERKEERSKRDKALRVLAVADKNRRNGVKLSAADLDLERRAFGYIKRNT